LVFVCKSSFVFIATSAPDIAIEITVRYAIRPGVRTSNWNAVGGILLKATALKVSRSQLSSPKWGEIGAPIHTQVTRQIVHRYANYVVPMRQILRR
jgi:hypothetical protein